VVEVGDVGARGGGGTIAVTSRRTYLCRTMSRDVREGDRSSTGGGGGKARWARCVGSSLRILSLTHTHTHKRILSPHCPSHSPPLPPPTHSVKRNKDGTDHCLGEGNFAWVLVCAERATGQVYAVKCIDAAKLGEDDVKGLRYELSLVKQLSHPNIMFFKDVRFFLLASPQPSTLIPHPPSNPQPPNPPTVTSSHTIYHTPHTMLHLIPHIMRRVWGGFVVI
jgi:hypothetical protein